MHEVCSPYCIAIGTTATLVSVYVLGFGGLGWRSGRRVGDQLSIFRKGARNLMLGMVVKLFESMVAICMCLWIIDVMFVESKSSYNNNASTVGIQ